MATNIIIIDDDSDFRTLLSVRLRSFLPDARLTEFTCLQEARDGVKQMNDEPIDLVVLDQHLPDGHGAELLEEGLFQGLTVLAVSSDSCPTIPGKTVSLGAAYFLGKDEVRSPLFQPLVCGVIDRNKLQQQLLTAEVDTRVLDLVKTHIGTLRHEINNPLGAVLGAAFLVRNSSAATPEQIEAAELVEKSGKRIKHVLDQICNALVSPEGLQPVMKAHQKVFHIPGDDPWDSEES